jgi:cytochrome P450
MTDIHAPSLDRDRLRELFDLRNNVNLDAGGNYADDPYPRWRELRAQAAVHPGTVHELTGYEGDAMFHGLPFPDRPHFSTFSYAVCDAAYRNPEVFASSPGAADGSPDDIGYEQSLLMMGGTKHRRYRSLVQPSFMPAKAQWWIQNWIEETVNTLIDAIVVEGRAELNVDFCAAIPVLTITGSFGISVEEALEVRSSLANPMSLVEHLAPIVAARREQPQDDLISVLVQAEITEEDGSKHRLSDPEIYSFAVLLDSVRQDRTLLKGAIEESLRWMPTDPMFSRWVAEDIDFFGAHLPKGAVLHLCIGAANRDPDRWERPDDYDPLRPLKPALGFGSGPHVCLGMHVARAEMSVGIGALLDRLPNLRLDEHAAPPSPVGLYERGVMEIPVVFDA